MTFHQRTPPTWLCAPGPTPHQLALAQYSSLCRHRAAESVAQGLLEPGAHEAGRAVLTDRGRLLADAVVRDLTE